MLIPAPKESWQYRAIQATGGNQTLMGCFVLAILGWQHGRKPPRLGSVATIKLDGSVVAHMQDRYGVAHPNSQLGPVQDIIDNFKGLADHLKLTDAERLAMFDELRKWFIKDERAKSTLE